MSSLVNDRRGFLQAAGVALAGLAIGAEMSSTEPRGASSEADDPPDKRVGFAVVGLGHVALGQVLPAIAHSKHAKLVSLVSGDGAKSASVALQYGVNARNIYGYDNYDRIADNDAVQVVYIALPNSMHAEYVVRAANAGKHVFCEKPMATSVADCQRMIEACRRTNRKLMIGYRNQYEPNNRALARLVRDGKLGVIREYFGINSQNQGDPEQWRLKRAMAGAGPLVDTGIYCINGVRFVTGEEPNEVMASWQRNTSDPRFREVEESIHVVMRFPSGMIASCGSSYNAHKSSYLRVNGTLGWAEMDPAYGYTGLRLAVNRVVERRNVTEHPEIEVGDQFLHEIDHMALCIQRNLEPHTPGEEGLQDQRIIEAIYQSAYSGRAVNLAVPGNTRGVALESLPV